MTNNRLLIATGLLIVGIVIAMRITACCQQALKPKAGQPWKDGVCFDPDAKRYYEGNCVTPFVFCTDATGRRVYCPWETVE